MAGVRGVARVRSVARMRTMGGELKSSRCMLKHDIGTRQIFARVRNNCGRYGVDRDNACVSARGCEDSANRCRKRFQEALLHLHAPLLISNSGILVTKR